MKILVAVHHFPPRYVSGAELRAYRTASWHRDHGHSVRVVAVEDITSKDKGLSFVDETYGGLAVRRLAFDQAATPDPFRWSYDHLWIGEHVEALLKEDRPDVLHMISGYMMTGSVLRAARRLRVPTVLTLTDFWFLCPRITLLRSNGTICSPPFDPVTCARCLGEERRRYRIPGRIAPGLMRAFWQRRSGAVDRIRKRMSFLRETLDQVDAIISPSRFLRDLFIDAGVAPERIVFSRQGRDFSALTEDMPVKTPSSALRLGYMGQIAPHKGVHTLFEAVGRLPDAALTVKAYGDVDRFPSYARRLERIAFRDSRVSLAGVYDRTEVSRVLRDIDVVVVPSIWYENSPNTILEAFAHRTPVVASDLGGMAELIDRDVTGLLFSPGDPVDLAAQLRRLVDEPGLQDALRKGIGPVKSVQQEMAELEAIYGAAVERAGRGSEGGDCL